MDFVSLSPSDDDLFDRHQEDQILNHHQSTSQDPTGSFPTASVPETPLPAARMPSGKRATPTPVFSTVHIPPGSSLLNIQNYSSSEDSSASPSRSPPSTKSPPSAKRERSGPKTVHRRRRDSPTPSPTRLALAHRHRPDTSLTTRSGSRHRFPGCLPDSKISDWTVVTLHKTLKEKGIPFHRSDNKAKLFNKLMSASSSPHHVNTC